jgi:hypothetical protein
MNLYEMARWWRKQSFSYDIGGNFNIELYLEILKHKSICTDYYTSQEEASERATTSQQKPLQIGKQENYTRQVLTD